jgi:hypothetical protein
VYAYVHAGVCQRHTITIRWRAANNKAKAGEGVRLNEISVGDTARSALGHLLAIYHPANMKLSR